MIFDNNNNNNNNTIKSKIIYGEGANKPYTGHQTDPVLFGAPGVESIR